MSLALVSEELRKRLKTASHAVFYLDFDGTLAPIVERPEDARAPRAVLDTLSALALDKRFTIAIVSGRAIADLKHCVGIPGLVYAGNHGLEIQGPGLSYHAEEAARSRPRMRDVLTALGEKLALIPGAQVEDKGLTASVHFRRVEASRRNEVVALVRSLVPYDDPHLVLRDAKMVVEIRPRVAWDKGEGVLWIRKALGLESPVEIYIGDDSTDEDAFRVLPGAFTIHVGASDRTAARYQLGDTTEVGLLLKSILDNKEAYGNAG